MVPPGKWPGNGKSKGMRKIWRVETMLLEQEALRQLKQRSMGINREGEKTVTEENSKGEKNFPPGHGTGE